MNYKESHPNAHNFLTAYFPESDLEGLTDKEVVIDYINEFDKSNPKQMAHLEQTKNELEELSKNIESHWLQVSDDSNRYFRDHKETLKWLKVILFEFQ